MPWRWSPALSCPADVTDPAAVSAVVERVVRTWGRIDVLVNNAGRGMAATVEATTAADLRALLELNLVALLTMTRAVLPGMLARRAGHIVNVGSGDAAACRCDGPALRVYPFPPARMLGVLSVLSRLADPPTLAPPALRAPRLPGTRPAQSGR